MRKRIKNKLSRLILFLLVFVFFTASTSICVEASWVDRDGSGIYEGEIDGGIDEDVDEEAGDGIEDEGSNWIMSMITGIITALPIAIGDALFHILDALGASLDNIIYGRLVSSTSYFTFGLENGNFYGIISAAIYNVLRGVMLLGCMVVFMARVAGSSWRRGQFAMGSLKEAFSSLLITILLLALMPYFVDVGLFLRDNILYLVASEGSRALFGTSSTSIIGVLRDVAADGIVNAFMYAAAVVLNVYFLANYVMIALSMVVSFILFPFVVMKSYFDRQVLSSWVWEMVSYAIIPVIDATLLMIPVYIGVYADRMGVTESFILTVLQVIICWGILTAREMARYILGIRVNPMERAGTGLSAFLAMHALHGAKNAVGEWKEARKNAKADEQKADMEDDLAQLDTEEAIRANQERVDAEAEAYAAARNFDTGMQYPETQPEGRHGLSDGDGYGEENGKREAKRAEDFANYDDGSALGLEQSYAENMQAHMDAEDLPSLKSVEEQLSQAKEQKERLQAEYEEISNDPTLSEDDRARQLNNLSKQMDKNEMQCDQLLGMKARIQKKLEEEDLSEEPVNLQKELNQIGDEKERLLEERQALVRKRNALKAEQDQFSGNDDQYQELGNQIQKTEDDLRDIDNRIGSCTGREKAVTSALRKQEQTLYDRQAYNLNERLKAQAKLEKAQADMDDCNEKLLAMDQKEAGGKHVNPAARREWKSKLQDSSSRVTEARQRLADLTVEDARIEEKLSEMNPDRNTYSLEDLQKAKGEQQVRRARAQSEIAVINAEVAKMDPSNEQDRIKIGEKKQRILNLTAEAADAGLQSARLDQLISGKQRADRMTAPGRPAKGRNGVVSNEYEKKRQAIMDRYANIDNFEEPQFADISREKRADLLRERALKTKRQAWTKGAGRAAGATAGAVAGFWFGPSGMVLGSMAGGELGAATVGLGHGAANAAGKVVELANRKKQPTPLNIRVSSDLHGNSANEQQEIARRILVNLDSALDGKLYEEAFTKELVQQNIKKAQVGKLLAKYNIQGAADYERMLPQLRKEFPSMVVSGMQEKEIQILEKCAGAEYVNLSENVKRKIVQKAVTEYRSSLMDMNEVQIEAYLPDHWEGEFPK